MKKSTKGALAAGTAAALLMGGATTLAFWTDDATVNGGEFNTGRLLIDPLGDTPCDANWTYAAANSGSGLGSAGSVVNRIVPGDTITKSCRFKVEAVGDNLSATLTTPATVPYTAPSTATSLSLPVSATYLINNQALPAGNRITAANNNQTLVARIEVSFPRGTNQSGNPVVNGNDTQNLLVTLNALTVSLAQN